MPTTTAPTGLTLDLRQSRYAAYGVALWGTKKDALAALAAWRDCGRNRHRDIEIHRAGTWLEWVWVIALPDHYNGITSLMTADGRWIAGRLTDSPCFCTGRCSCHGTPWTPLGRDAQPATVTHDYGYSAGWTGVIDSTGKPLMATGYAWATPRQVEAWSTTAWCIAGTWVTHGDHEDSTRQQARWHRANPERYADHATPRRLPRTAQA